MTYRRPQFDLEQMEKSIYNKNDIHISITLPQYTNRGFYINFVASNIFGFSVLPPRFLHFTDKKQMLKFLIRYLHSDDFYQRCIQKYDIDRDSDLSDYSFSADEYEPSMFESYSNNSDELQPTTQIQTPPQINESSQYKDDILDVNLADAKTKLPLEDLSIDCNFIPVNNEDAARPAQTNLSYDNCVLKTNVKSISLPDKTNSCNSTIYTQSSCTKLDSNKNPLNDSICIVDELDPNYIATTYRQPKYSSSYIIPIIDLINHNYIEIQQIDVPSTIKKDFSRCIKNHYTIQNNLSYFINQKYGICGRKHTHGKYCPIFQNAFDKAFNNQVQGTILPLPYSQQFLRAIQNYKKYRLYLYKRVIYVP